MIQDRDVYLGLVITEEMVINSVPTIKRNKHNKSQVPRWSYPMRVTPRPHAMANIQ